MRRSGWAMVNNWYWMRIVKLHKRSQCLAYRWSRWSRSPLLVNIQSIKSTLQCHSYKFNQLAIWTTHKNHWVRAIIQKVLRHSRRRRPNFNWSLKIQPLMSLSFKRKRESVSIITDFRSVGNASTSLACRHSCWHASLHKIWLWAARKRNLLLR